MFAFIAISRQAVAASDDWKIVMEVVIDRQKITIDARISMEEVLLVEVDPTALYAIIGLR